MVRGLAVYQAGLGLRVEVACDPDGGLARSLTAAGVRVHPWRASRSPLSGLVDEIGAMARIVEDVHPDMTHLHGAKAGLVGRLVLRGRVRTVFEPHAWSWWALRTGERWLARAWEEYALRWTDQVVCLSREEALAMPACWRRMTLGRNGVDTDYWAPRDRAGARRVLGMASEGPVVVCAGRVCRQKGQDILVKAFRRLLTSCPQARLVVVGGGPMLGRLRQQAAGLPAMFPGMVADPRDWYAAADVVVSPSRWEGAALTVLEAAAMGRVVVATNVGGVRDDQSLAVSVAPGDPVGLAEAMVSLLTDPARRNALAVTARRTVLDRYVDRWAYAQLTEAVLGLADAEAMAA